jgi:hypothetical protein
LLKDGGTYPFFSFGYMDARYAHFIDGLRGSVGKDNIAGFDNARDCCSVPGLEAFSLGEAGLLIGGRDEAICFCKAGLISASARCNTLQSVTKRGAFLQ